MARLKPTATTDQRQRGKEENRAAADALVDPDPLHFKFANFVWCGDGDDVAGHLLGAAALQRRKIGASGNIFVEHHHSHKLASAALDCNFAHLVLSGYYDCFPFFSTPMGAAVPPCSP
jgi:hypothetical protein